MLIKYVLKPSPKNVTLPIPHYTHIFIVTFIITFSKTRVERSDHTIHVMERGWIELMASNANTEEGI